MNYWDYDSEYKIMSFVFVACDNVNVIDTTEQILIVLSFSEKKLNKSVINEMIIVLVALQVRKTTHVS